MNKCEKCGEYIDEYGLCCCLSDETKDNMAVDKFAAAMKDKLAKARGKGRSGWDDKDKCSDEHLADLFYSHLDKGNDGNFLDLANFCMFLYVRGAKPNILHRKCEICRFFRIPKEKHDYVDAEKECNLNIKIVSWFSGYAFAQPKNFFCNRFKPLLKNQPLHVKDK